VFFVLQDFANRVAASEIALHCDQSVAITTEDGQIIPNIVARVAVDMVFFDRLTRHVADAAGMAVRH